MELNSYHNQIFNYNDSLNNILNDKLTQYIYKNRQLI